MVPPTKPGNGEPTERTHLLTAGDHNRIEGRERRGSGWSNVDATHLSPVTPLIDARRPSDAPAVEAAKPTTPLQKLLFNTFAVLMVCAAGVLGWWVSSRSQGHIRHRHRHRTPKPDDLEFDFWGQTFGYLCALLYLGSRVPQLLLNYRRKSTEGVSMLFFLFACIGNLTYVLSIFAFEGKCQGPRGACRPGEAAQLYGRYILLNASWLAGSLGTLFLDFGIFAQFFMYRDREEEQDDEATTAANGYASRRADDDRPLLQRNDSTY